MFERGVYRARHLGRDGGVGLAVQMGIVAVPRDVAFELVTEAVGAFEYSNLSSHPEGSAKSRIAVFRDAALAAEHVGLHGCEIHATELQDLAVMAETARIAGLRQDGQGIDRADTGNGC